jgi:EmrB/QacA subfamily drug resistance transporter
MTRRRNLWFPLALMVAAQFLVILDSSIVNVALPTIQHGLGFTAVGVEGVITAYATAFGGALILGGRIADLFGRRRVFLASLLAFALTSLACALALSPELLIVSRAAQGLSAAALAPSALALLTTTFPEGAERNRALGAFGSATAIGFVAGQILGGVLTFTAGWRAIFLVNVPVAALAAILALRAIKADSTPAVRRMPDVLGAALITAAMALGVWAPTRGAAQGWISPSFLIVVVVALILLGLFVWVETRSHDPLVRLSILKSRWLTGTSIATALTGVLNGAVMLVCTLFLQQIHGYSPILAGLAFAPTGLAGLLAGAHFAGPLVTHWGIRTVLTVAMTISAAAIVGLSRLPGDGPYLSLMPWLIIIGASFTTAAVATTVAVSTGVAPEEQGMAAALRQTAFQLGVALGVAILLSVAASHTAALLAGAHPPAVPDATTAGYRLVLVVLSALAAAGALVSLVTLRTPPSARSRQYSPGRP